MSAVPRTEFEDVQWYIHHQRLLPKNHTGFSGLHILMDLIEVYYLKYGLILCPFLKVGGFVHKSGIYL